MTDEPGRPENLTRIVGDQAEPSFVLDLDGRVVALNGLAAELLGVDPSVAIGSRCWALLRGTEPGGRLVCEQTCPILAAARGGDSSTPVDLLIPVFHFPTRSTSGWLRSLVHNVTLRNGRGQPTALLHLLAPARAHGQHERDDEDGHARGLTAEDPTRAHLSQREWQVLRLLADGLTTRQVAECLGIAYTTARNHAQHILEKLGAPNRVAALTRVFGVPGSVRWMSGWLSGVPWTETRRIPSPTPPPSNSTAHSTAGAGLVPSATQARGP